MNNINQMNKTKKIIITCVLFILSGLTTFILSFTLTIKLLDKHTIERTYTIQTIQPLATKTITFSEIPQKPSLITAMNNIDNTNKTDDTTDESIKEPKETSENITKEQEDTTSKTKLQYNVREESGTLYATTNVNIRKEPTIESEIIGYLSYAKSIEKTGICDNGWTQVKYNNSIAYINSKYLQDTEIKIQETKPEQSAQVQQPAYTGIIQRQGNISDDLLRTIDNYYYMLPENVRNLLQNNGWQFICSENDFAAEYGYTYSILALTVYESKISYIDNQYAAKETILHEAGHAFDSLMGYISYSEEFAQIYQEEKTNFCNIRNTHPNNTATTCEYFAEAFDYTIINPTSMSTNCPKTYEYIMRYINSI